MFRRGVASLAFAGVMSLAVAVPAVFADTVGGGNSDLYEAGGALGDGSVQVFAFVGTQDGNSVHFIVASTLIVVAITCPDGSDGITFTRLLAETPTAVKIDKKLKTATASGTVVGTEERYNSCTDEDLFVDVTREVSLDLHATGGSSTTRNRSVIKNPDGSKLVTTSRIESRNAGGTMTIGGTSYTAETGVSTIAHEVATEKTIPPKGH